MGLGKVRPTWIYKLGDDTITKQREEKDLGVVIQDDLSPEKHIDTIFGNAYGMLWNIRMIFQLMNKDMMKKMLTTLIRPKLEYAEVVWSPYKKKHINRLERIQRIATKMLPELKDLSYRDRLKEMKLTALQE